MSDSSQRKTLYLTSLDGLDHRALFSRAEIVAAYGLVLTQEQAEAAAADIMDGAAGTLPGKATFMGETLDLLAHVSPDTARRVRIARGLS